MKKVGLFLVPLFLSLCSCIKIDFFLFANGLEESIEDSYHGLLLYAGSSSPEWITEASASIEREIYLTPEGKLIEPGDIGLHREYIHGCFLPSPRNAPAESCPLTGSNVTFLYTHGNSGGMFKYWYRAVSLWSMGANVFIFSYRGYGLSKGETTRASVKMDADAAATYLKSRKDIDTSRIIIYGYSMGAVTASYLSGTSAHRNTFAGTILEAGLDSPENIVEMSSGISFPGGFFLDTEPFNGPQFIKNTTKPVLHFHGQKDTKVTPEQAKSYYEVLKDHPGYTHHIGRGDDPMSEWISKAAHGNLPFTAFSAPKQISDYWNYSGNEFHCCINPFEFEEEQFQSFLRDVGNTTGSEMSHTAAIYREFISGWVLGTFTW